MHQCVSIISLLQLLEVELVLTTLHTVSQFSPVVLKGHKINLRGRQMINYIGNKKKNKLCYINLHLFFLDFSLIFCCFFKMLDNFTSFGSQAVIQMKPSEEFRGEDSAS